MSPQMVGVIGIIVLMIFLFARMNIGLAMASVGFFGFAYISGLKASWGMLSTTPYITIASYSMSALPLFILMGAVVSNTGMGSDLYSSAYKWLGQLRGGLALATVATCALFAAICGSSMAETLTIGKIALPEMRKYRYDDALATGCVASGGTLGILIPPSIGFLLYGILTEQSIGLLFMAGILPGVLLTCLFMGVVSVWTLRNPKAGAKGEKTSFKEKIVSLKRTWTTVVLFLLVLGGLYLGIFTPTEAGAIGAFGAILIAFFNRQLSLKSLLNSVLDAGMTTAMILILMVGAFIFMRFLAVSQLTNVMAKTIGGLGLSPYVVFALIVVLYLILGMFLDIIACIILTVPLLVPVIVHLGFDPVWFGVQIVILTEMGLITPPVGMNVFILSAVTDTPMGTIFRGVWPFVGAMMLCVIILTIWPQIALFIPSMM